MDKPLTFSETEIQSLFGHEAAEDENPSRLKNYYFKNHIFDQVITDLSLRILVGHKGTGKSALFKVAISEEEEQNKLAILIKPDDITGLTTNEEDFLKIIRHWKESLLNIIAKKIFAKVSLDFSDKYQSRLIQHSAQFLSSLAELFKDITKTGISIPESKKVFIENFLKTNKIYIYIDDLDRGWQGRKEDITRISALLNAARDISNDNPGVFFRISLRSDVYFLVRTADESTDKIEGSVIWHTWTNHQIFVLLLKRIESFFGRPLDETKLLELPQHFLAENLSPIMETRFTGRGMWENAPMYRVLMTLIRRRPRDLVKLCTLSARKSRERQHTKILTRDLQDSFEEYSQGRLQDTINEFRTELPDISRLLMSMKPNKREKKARAAYTFKTDELLTKIKNIQESGVFYFANQQNADAKQLAGFLYKINFLTARKDKENEILRRYFEESRYLQNEFSDFGFDWEIHPAFRWALQPDRIEDILSELKLSADS